MKEYELHISASYISSGGAEEGSYFVEYVMALSAEEAQKLKRDELAAGGYYNISIDTIEA